MVGIIKGNTNVTDLLKRLKTDKTQYPILNKEQERAIIEQYKDDEYKWRDLLIMHNIRSVFSMSKKYMTGTKSYDDMIQKGLLGLVIASRRFNPNEKRINKKTGKEDVIKFSTYAKNWIFKMLVDEFYQKEFNIESNSVSLSTPMNQDSSSNENNTYENYVENHLHPLYSQKASTRPDDNLSAMEADQIFDGIYEFVELSNELSVNEKDIFKSMFKNSEKTSSIAKRLNLDVSEVLKGKKHCINLIKDQYLDKKFNIKFKNELV